MVKRIESIPGVEVLPYWQAKYYTPNVLTSVRAIVWHFAQGGGTDSWLTRADGAQGRNSCHIVLKYSGAIRQLVELDDASWSLHIDQSGSYQNFGIFGIEHVKAALGTGWTDPNRYIIAIEIEGYWDDGPNAAQLKTIPLLARYLEGLFPAAVHLGHRDFQNYKACPGPSLFRGLLPHAGRLTNNTGEPNDEMSYYIDRTVLPFGGRFTIPAGAAPVGIKLDLATGRITETKKWVPRDDTSTAAYSAVVITNITRGNPFLEASNGFFEGYLVSSASVIETPNPAPEPADTTPFSQEQLDAAVKAATDPLKAALAAERADDATVAAQLEAAAAALRQT